MTDVIDIDGGDGGHGNSRDPYENAQSMFKVFMESGNMLFSSGVTRHEIICGLLYAALNTELTEIAASGVRTHLDTARHRMHQDIDRTVDRLAVKTCGKSGLTGRED